MEKWVSTREASKINEIGLSQHRIAELARLRKIETRRTGKKWRVKGTSKNGKWDLVWTEQAEQGQVATERLSKEAAQDTRLREHLDEVATTAKLLASRVEKLVYYRDSEHEIHTYEGNIVDGLRFFGRHVPDNMASSIESYLARYVLAHYEDKFDRLYCGYFENVTMENASQELADNLLRLANDEDSKPCPICPACQEITGMYPIGRDWIRTKDEKTGKKSYMPADF